MKTNRLLPLRRGLWGTLSIIIVMLSTPSTSPAIAIETGDILAEAEESFAKREARENDPALEKTIDLLREAPTFPEGDDRERRYKFESLILLSKAYFSAGTFVHCNAFGEDSKDLPCYQTKDRYLDLARRTALIAKSLDGTHAEGHYYYAKALAAWSEFHSSGEWLKSPREIRPSLKLAERNKTLDGEPGESLDGYGPSRVGGWVSLKMPSGFGHNFTHSYLALRKAVRNAPYVPTNHFFFAMILRYLKRKDDYGLTAKEMMEGLLGDTNSPEAAADHFIERFKGTDFEAKAMERRQETIVEFRETVREAAGYVGAKLPWDRR